jgi:hypothetical protein
MSYLLTKDSVDNVIDLILENIDGNTSEIKLPEELTKEGNLLLDNILEPYEQLMMLSLEKKDDREYRVSFVKQFFTCLDSAEITFDDLYKLYI